jgi:hypothetical protein
MTNQPVQKRKRREEKMPGLFFHRSLFTPASRGITVHPRSAIHGEAHCFSLFFQ